MMKEKSKKICNKNELDSLRLKHKNIISELKEKLEGWSSKLDEKFEYFFKILSDCEKTDKFDNYEIQTEEFLIKDFRVVDNYIKNLKKSLHNNLIGKKRTTDNEIFYSEADLKMIVKKSIPKKEEKIKKKDRKIGNYIKDHSITLGIYINSCKQQIETDLEKENIPFSDIFICFNTPKRYKKIFEKNLKYFDEHLSTKNNARFLFGGKVKSFDKVFKKLNEDLCTEKNLDMKIKIVENKKHLFEFFDTCEGIFDDLELNLK
jgi:hypothetical protein